MECRAQVLRLAARRARECHALRREGGVERARGLYEGLASLMDITARLEPATMQAQPQRRPLVLVVDDDDDSAPLLARLLRSDGYDTEVTNDGAAALQRLTRDPVPDAIVTDFHLPYADGLAVGRGLAHFDHATRLSSKLWCARG